MSKRNLPIISLVLFVIIYRLLSPTYLSGAQLEDLIDFKELRDRMVRYQIEARGIKDEGVLAAMRRVERHRFVSANLAHLAYEDTPLPIQEGQTISQPYIVALMTELLQLKGNERVLEIGTGSGYQAAILAELTNEVYSVEILEPLARQAEALVKELGYKNIQVKYGDGYLGWPEFAPFDAIIVTCAPEDIPTSLIEQLAEGGRLVIPVGSRWQDLKLLQKKEGRLLTANVIPVRFVPMLRNKMDITDDEQEEQMTENLKKHIKILSEDIGERNFIQYQNLQRAADYIKQEFTNYGYLPQEDTYYSEGKLFRNIIASSKAKLKPDGIIIVCAHYDSVVGSPGADDNASGVAGLLELARLVSRENLNKTVRFLAVPNEEPPLFMSQDMGSTRYAQRAKKNRENILGVICLESIGYYTEKKKSQSYPFGLNLFYPDKGNFIALVSNFPSHTLLRTIAKEFKKKSSFPLECLVGFSFLTPAISFSDHWSFWRFGYKAVMVTDTAFYRNTYYHTPADVYKTLDFSSMSRVIEGLHQALLKLAN